MSTHDFDPSVQSFTWQTEAEGLSDMFDTGLVPEGGVVAVMNILCSQSLKDGSLPNLGVLQAFLRERDSAVQLVAVRFNPEDPAAYGRECVDIVTGEPRNHWAMVSVGRTASGTEASRQLQRTYMTDEVNETALARDTGILV